MFDINGRSECHVALLAGGKSSEREISLASGDGAQKALLEAGFTVERLDPAVSEDLQKLLTGQFDVAFLCTHGRGGEDGALQGFLEVIGLPYTGSGVLGSAISMNKAVSKMVYETAGVPTAPAVVLHAYDRDEKMQVLTDFCAEYGSKCVIKAASEGSSVGVYIAEGMQAVQEAVDEAFTFDTTVVVERYVAGTELTVVVLGDNDARALPIIEIVPKNESYDFEAKYAPGGSEHICPARIDETAASLIQDYAVRAHQALGCSGVSRTDFILDESGNPWALETNTLPGMTETSLLPDAARAVGISFPELCASFIEDALSKVRR